MAQPGNSKRKLTGDDAERCFCDSELPFAQCCEPLLLGQRMAPTAQALMRSRYSAYASGNLAYLQKTWHPTTRPSTLTLDPLQRWLGLKIKYCKDGGPNDEQGVVSFVARFKLGSKGYALREVSEFQRVNGAWLYLQGQLES